MSYPCISFFRLFINQTKKFDRLQPYLNPQPLSSLTFTKPFDKTGQMVEICYEYLSVWCIDWFFLSCHIRIWRKSTLYSAWMSSNPSLKIGMISETEVITTELEPTTNYFANDNSTI